MKKTTLLLLATLMGGSMFSTLQAAESTTQKYFGYDSNEVPEDWTNDIWLNANFKTLTVGGTYTIGARRVPEIVENLVSTNTVLPEFTYEIVQGSSATVDTTGVVTATGLGTTIIEVGYTATEAFDKTYDAISPINKTYMAIEVVADTVSTAEMKSSLAEDAFNTYNTYYYTGAFYNFPVSYTATGATDSYVVCNGDTLKSETGEYMLNLTNRANVIELAATTSEGVEREFYVVDARKIEVNIENVTDSGTQIAVGDKAHISFKGIVPAVYKLATIYNPQMGAWGGSFSTASYTAIQPSGDSMVAKTNYEVTQYDLHSNNTIEMTFDSEGSYVFEDGMIDSYWWGSALGTDKGEGANDSNLSAPTTHAELGALPSFAIQVVSDKEESNQIVLDLSKPTNPTEILYNENDVWTETYTENSYPYIEFDEFMFRHLPSNTSWWGSSWEGFTVSQSQDNELGHNDGYLRQWGNMAQGGVAGKGTPYILGYYSYYNHYSSSDKTSPTTILMRNGAECIMQGTYINLTAYSANVVLFGDAGTGSAPFATNDSLVLIAQGLDETGKIIENSSVRKALADYRNTKTNNWRLNQEWEWMDLTALGKVYGVSFIMESSDNGSFGPNTPTYFALDGLSAVPTGTTTSVESTLKAEATIAVMGRELTVVSSQISNLVVLDLQGAVVLQTIAEEGTTNINLQNLATGIYIVRLGDLTRKVVIK